jgi:hypothetical protein
VDPEAVIQGDRIFKMISFSKVCKGMPCKMDYINVQGLHGGDKNSHWRWKYDRTQFARRRNFRPHPGGELKKCLDIMKLEILFEGVMS